MCNLSFLPGYGHSKFRLDNQNTAAKKDILLGMIKHRVLKNNIVFYERSLSLLNGLLQLFKRERSLKQMILELNLIFRSYLATRIKYELTLICQGVLLFSDG